MTITEVFERLINEHVEIIREVNADKDLSEEQIAEKFKESFPVFLETFTEKLSPEVREKFLRELNKYVL